MLTMFWHNTNSSEDGVALYQEIERMVAMYEHTDIIFKTEITKDFAHTLLDNIYNGKLPLKDIKLFIRFKGFADLKQKSWENMNDARTQIHNAMIYETYYGCERYLDGW